MKRPVYYGVELAFFPIKERRPAHTDPALYPTNYWIVKRKDSTYVLADAYKCGRFYYDGTYIKDVIEFSVVYLP